MELALIAVVAILVLVLGFAAWMMFQVQQATKLHAQGLEQYGALEKKLSTLQAALDETTKALLAERITHGEQVVRLTELASGRLTEITRLEAELARLDPAAGGDRLRRVLSEGADPAPRTGVPSPGSWGGGMSGRPPAKP